MSDIASKISVKLHKSYETPSMLDITKSMILLYVNIERFLSGEKNRMGEEPVVAYVQIDEIEDGPDGGEVTMTILHQGPTRTLKLPMMALVSVADTHVHHTSNGDRIHFFIDKMQKR
jgi:hypothetical protein